MTIRAVSTASSTVREMVGEAEWEARVELAACYRLMAYFG